MSTEHIETRKKMRSIATKDDFNALLEQSTLSDRDKTIMRMHYLEEKDFRFIGDSLGYSEQTIKYRHRKALRKISKML